MVCSRVGTLVAAVLTGSVTLSPSERLLVPRSKGSMEDDDVGDVATTTLSRMCVETGSWRCEGELGGGLSVRYSVMHHGDGGIEAGHPEMVKFQSRQLIHWIATWD